jgi:ABC-type uncharacterized transport system involved in gliding motility auxiliary subunit
MNNKKQKSSETMTNILWVSAGVLFLALLFARVVFPEYLGFTILTGLPLIGALVALVVQNQKALKSRSAAFGLNSAVTVALVIAIVGVLNFLSARYPAKLDLTQNKKHTLSDQSIKLTKGLTKTVKATVFTAQRDKFRPILDNYKALNPKFEVEYVDPFREPARVKAAGIHKADTLVLSIENKENKIDDLSEEKITNSLIKLLKDKSPVLCAITGHGEKSFSAADAEGYETTKKALTSQYYEVRDVNLLQETKLPESCDAIAIMGPTKAYFDPEVKIIRDYLSNGGRAIVALDLNLRGSEYNPELISVLEQWHVKPSSSIIIDPVSKMFGADATVAISPANSYSRESAITKEFRADCIFPISRPLDTVSGAPAGLKVEWIAQTTPNAFGSQIEKGAVHVNPAKDKKGPHNLIMAVEGKQKDSKAGKNSRLIVIGTSNIATNQFARVGGNLDLFMNSVSWVMEDESLISIRAKDDVSGKIEISQKAGSFIGLFTILVLPLLISAGGISIWWYRRKL